MPVMNVDGTVTSTIALLNEIARYKPIMKSFATAADGAVAGDELGPVLFLLRENRIRLEAAAAAGFVGAHRSDDDQLLAFDEAVSVNRWVATANADGQQLGDFFRDRQKARHRLERAAALIRSLPSNPD